MNISEQIQYWFELSDDDIIVAESIFQSKHYLWCLFICHLSVEKILKGLYVQNCLELPPKIHDLVKLAKSSKLEISEVDLRFLNELNRFNIEGRYPEYKNNLKTIADLEYTSNKLIKTKEILKWLKSLRK